MTKQLSCVGILLLSLGVASCSKEDQPPSSTGTGGSPSIGSGVAQRDALRNALEGTTWYWGEKKADQEPVLVRLDKDQVVHCDPWDAKGLVTVWTPIDRRTVLLRVEKGRDNDRYAIMMFTEDLQEYSGWDFLPNTRLPPNQKAGKK